MGFILGILWCVIFGALGVFLIKQREKHADYPSFMARVVAVEKIGGRHTATLESGIARVGKFQVQFQDLGDFYEGQTVECMWDGQNPSTAQQDLRQNQKLGIVVSFSFVALMLVILFFALIV